MRVKVGSKHLNMSVKEAKKMAFYFSILRDMEARGEAGRINNKTLAEELKKHNRWFNIRLMFEMAYLGVVNLYKPPFRNAKGYTSYRYNWSVISSHLDFRELLLLDVKRFEDRVARKLAGLPPLEEDEKEGKLEGLEDEEVKEEDKKDEEKGCD